MRILAILLGAALAATPALATQDALSAPPEQSRNVAALEPDEADLGEALAAAQAHPLGTAGNPVRVGGPDGEHAYIARLRCTDGSQPKIGRRSSMGVGAFGTIVDGYPLDCGAAAPKGTILIMDMYHAEHVENRAPPGFTIAPR